MNKKSTLMLVLASATSLLLAGCQLKPQKTAPEPVAPAPAKEAAPAATAPAQDKVIQQAPDATPVAEAGLANQQTDATKAAAPGAASAIAAIQAGTTSSVAPAGAAAAAPQVSIEDSYQQLLKAVDGWKDAWAGQNVDAYLSYYASDYQPPKGTLAAWKADRAERIKKPKWIKIELGEPQVAIVDSHAIIRFEQNYKASNFSDKVTKELEMIKEDGQWKIKREDTL